MTDVQLGASYLDGGITTVNFFNGRVLTAEDLRSQQTGLTDRDRRLGRALGHGVAAGFRVTKRGPATLGVAPGVAVNPMGDVLQLSGAGVDVPLVVVDDAPTTTDAGFSPCAPGSAFGLTGKGVYVFCVSSASADKGGTPGVDFDSGGTAVYCGPRYTIEGLSFRLVEVDVAGLAATAGLDAADVAVLGTPETGDRRKLRNVLAHLFLGTAPARSSYVDPFGDALPVPIDELRREGKLTGCDVPLALVTWVDSGPAPGIELVDRWSVRRPLVPGGSPAREGVDGPSTPLGITPGPGWGWLPSRHRHADRLASLVQFQQQVHELAETTVHRALSDVRAVHHFRYLPAAGVVPVNDGVRTRRAFDKDKFFDDVRVAATGRIAAEKVEALLRASLWHPPVDLGADEAIFVYTVTQGPRAVARLRGVTMPFVVFSATSIDFEAEDLEITSVFPSGPLHPGDPVEVRGHGFGVSTETARVTFGALPAEPGRRSTDRKLLVSVPKEIPVPEGGGRVTLRARNGALEDSVPVIVIPEEAEVDQDIVITWASVDREELHEGEDATFTFEVGSRLRHTADIAIDVTPSPRQEIALLDWGREPLEKFPEVPAGEDRDLVVRLGKLEGVLPPMGSFHSARLAREVVTLIVSASAATAAGKVRRSEIFPFEIGVPIEPPDDDITFEVKGFEATGGRMSAGSWDRSTNRISLPAEGTGVLELTVWFARAGTFARRVKLVGSGTGWSAAFKDVEQDEMFVVTADDLGPGGIEARPIRVSLTAGSGALPTALVTLVVQELEESRRKTKTFELVLASDGKTVPVKDSDRTLR